MKEINILQINFGSYIKLSCTMYLMFGIIFGVISLLMGIFGGDVTFTLGKTIYTGMTAGIINVFFGPIMSIIAGFIYGLLTFFPFHFFIKWTKGLKLRVVAEERPIHKTEQS